jgi:serine/threonine protein kinase
LIQAVRKLHSIGLLHCDINNSNIAWSDERKRVSLIDFGHTQRVDGASAYGATKGFEAPEITEKQPHSRVTDTYSVGKTIAEVLESVEQSSVGGQQSNDNDYDGFDTLQTIIKKLTALVSSDRMTLEEAESLMTTAQTSTGSPPQKRQNTGQAIPITPTPGNTEG